MVRATESHRRTQKNTEDRRDKIVWLWPLYAVKWTNAEAALLLETHLNDVPQRQKFSGAAHRRRRGAGHQSESAGPRLSGKAHRRRPLPGLRQYAKPCIQGAA